MGTEHEIAPCRRVLSKKYLLKTSTICLKYSFPTNSIMILELNLCDVQFQILVYYLRLTKMQDEI
ncbi:hypothetical protein PHJA_000431200 [Phtheirospermum japonicum]|uniref:Uncharacterized protein n=1 Tax=Phtheirospermum japonicum TaxID=374723 RepID=A0A830BLC4_9LAMI|nr:hypothetical protein PHJA_000431200 [Phtheirospermum japonicum]